MCCVACPGRERANKHTAAVYVTVPAGGTGSHPAERQELLFPAVGKQHLNNDQLFTHVVSCHKYISIFSHLLFYYFCLTIDIFHCSSNIFISEQ